MLVYILTKISAPLCPLLSFRLRKQRVIIAFVLRKSSRYVFCIQVAKLKFVCGGGFVFDLDLAWMDLETDSIMLPFISGQYATHATVVINGATMPGFAKKN